jgi:NADH-quinone oxidoreductase subunit C
VPEEQVNGANSNGVADDPSADRAALERALEVVNQSLPGAGVEIDETPPEGALQLDATHLVEACRVLKEDAGLRFTIPLFCTAVDWLDREPRFDLVYQLRSLHLQAAIRAKVRVQDRLDGLPSVPSLTGVWKGMGYLEREVYDLFGIEFDGHPDLRRILMPVDWEGYPLRKDYVSFGEPVKFTDRGSFPPDAAVPRGSEQ